MAHPLQNWDLGVSSAALSGFSMANYGVCGSSGAWKDNPLGQNTCRTFRSDKVSRQCGCAGVWSDRICRRKRVRRTNRRTGARPCVSLHGAKQQQNFNYNLI